MNSKDSYQLLCQSESSIPIFLQDWWLDATAGAENWDVSLVCKNEEILAALPYLVEFKWHWMKLTQPPLTQFLGPWLKLNNAKNAKLLSQEKSLLTNLILGLPDFADYRQNWSVLIKNWLPFYWKGFSQTTYYTYILKDIINTNLIWNGFLENIKTDIRKAQNRYHLKVRTDLDIQDFSPLNHMTFSRQNKALPYSEDLVKKIYEACLKRNQGKLFIAEDPQGQLHAGVFIIWDQHSAYYLLGGNDPTLRNSGAMSLCLWEAIQFSASVTENFNFEGSMIEPIERYFRAFGAIQTPYFRVTKTPSKILKAKYLIDEIKSIWCKK